MPNSPLVSICIPLYQQSKFILETLASCAAQTYPNLEILVVDDHSPDLTPALEEDILKLDPRIRLFKNSTNLGLEKNWNRALELCQGSFIKLVCGDDLIDPQCIKTQLEVLLANPKLSLVSCSRRIIDSRSRVILENLRTKFLVPTSFQNGVPELIRSGTNLIGEPMCGLFRKGPFQYSGEHPYLIDLDLWCKIWKTGELVILPETLASFRIHSQSLSSILGGRQAGEFIAFSKKLAQAFPGILKRRDRFLGAWNALIKMILRNIFFSFFRFV